MAQLDDIGEDAISAEPAANWMTRRYLLALSIIALLALSAFLIFQQATQQSLKVQEAIDVAGRQRALSQTTALHLQSLAELNLLVLAGQVTADDHANRHRDVAANLTRTLDLMEEGHQTLTSGGVGFLQDGTLPETLKTIYFKPPFNLDQQTRDFITDARAILRLPLENQTLAQPAVQDLIQQRANRLLQSLDLAVTVYNREGNEALEQIRFVQIALMFATIATLILEAILIFRPMVSRVEREIAENKRISSELRVARDGLEDEVIRRTKDLEDARAEAVQANIAKSRFLAHASHDLSQPLEAMNLFVGALDRQSDSKRVKAITHDLRAAQRSMRQLLAALLDISQIEAGVITPNPEPLRLSALFSQLAAEYAPLAGEKGLTFKLVQTDHEVMVDRMLLERILRNLITNAIRYTDEGSVLLGCRHHPADDDGNRRVRIEVRDSGPGIPPHDLESIFEEFKQLDFAGRDKSEGLGLGLTIAKRTADLIDETLDVRSQEGCGSVFSVTVTLI
ncbi:MAG: sensor histidine kinase [Alphaproteobacteria bacterium]